MNKAPVVAIVGQEGQDPTGLLYEAACRRRGLEYFWVDIHVLLEDVVNETGRSLLHVTKDDPHAATVVRGEWELRPEASIRRAQAALIVSLEYEEFLSPLTWVLDAAGFAQPNRPAAVDQALDKWAARELSEAAGLSTARGALVRGVEEALGVGTTLGYPLVVKELTSSQGTGVRLARSAEELREIGVELDLEGRKFLVEHYLECHGADIRVVIVGGEIVAAMQRQAKPGEFRANLAIGGSAVPVEISAELADATRRAVRAVGVSFAGVDFGCVAEIIPGRDYLGPGEYCWFETNSFAGLKGLFDTTGIDGSDAVLDLLVGLSGETTRVN